MLIRTNLFNKTSFVALGIFLSLFVVFLATISNVYASKVAKIWITKDQIPTGQPNLIVVQNTGTEDITVHWVHVTKPNGMLSIYTDTEFTVKHDSFRACVYPRDFTFGDTDKTGPYEVEVWWEGGVWSGAFLAVNQTGGVGGVVISVDKFGLLAPYIGLASTILVNVAATAVYVKRVRHGKEKQ